jgi:ferrous iron transport protein A
MKLGKGKIGKSYIVNNIGGSTEMKNHLVNLGLEVGDRVTVISKVASNIVVGIKSSRYGIDERIANIIEVEK